MRVLRKIKRFIKDLLFFVIEILVPFLDKSRPIDNARVKKILVVEGGGIGDLLRILPAIECLSDNFPEANISLLASPGAQGVLPLFTRREVILEVIDYDLTGKHMGFIKKLSLIRLLKKKQFDLIYSPSRGEGMRELILMNFLLGVPPRIGFKQGRVGRMNTVGIEFADNISILKQNLALLASGNLKITKEDIDIRLSEETINKEERLIGGPPDADNSLTISIHTGALWNAEYRRWPIVKYISLIKILVEELQAKVVLIGSESEIETGKEILRNVPLHSVVNIIGRTTIAEMAAVINLSQLFIGNDSGPLHLALALKVQSVAIFGFTSPHQVLSTRERCIVINKQLPPSSLYMHQYKYTPNLKDVNYLNQITVGDIMDGVRKALFNNSSKISSAINN